MEPGTPLLLEDDVIQDMLKVMNTQSKLTDMAKETEHDKTETEQNKTESEQDNTTIDSNFDPDKIIQEILSESPAPQLDHSTQIVEIPDEKTDSVDHLSKLQDLIDQVGKKSQDERNDTPSVIAPKSKEITQSMEKDPLLVLRSIYAPVQHLTPERLTLIQEGKEVMEETPLGKAMIDCIEGKVDLQALDPITHCLLVSVLPSLQTLQKRCQVTLEFMLNSGSTIVSTEEEVKRYQQEQDLSQGSFTILEDPIKPTSTPMIQAQNQDTQTKIEYTDQSTQTVKSKSHKKVTRLPVELMDLTVEIPESQPHLESCTIDFPMLMAKVQAEVQKIPIEEEGKRDNSSREELSNAAIGKFLHGIKVSGNNSVDQTFMKDTLRLIVPYFEHNLYFLSELAALKKIMMDPLFTRVHYSTRIPSIHKLTNQLMRMVDTHCPPVGISDPQERSKITYQKTMRLKKAYIMFLEACNQRQEALRQAGSLPHGLSKPSHRPSLSFKDPQAYALDRKIDNTTFKVRGGVHPIRPMERSQCPLPFTKIPKKH